MQRPPLFPLFAATALVLLATATPAQIIPPERLNPWQPGVRGGIPWVPYAVDLADFGAVGDGVADDGPAFNDAIAAVDPPGFVWVPPGDYRIATIVQLADGVVLQGAGPAASRLLIDLPDAGFRGGVEMRGSLETAEIAVLSGAEYGSTALELDSTEGIAEGDLLWLFQDDDDPKMYSAEYWRTSYSPHSMGQMVGVAAVDDATVTLDVPLRLDYSPELSPRVRRSQPIRDAGIEGLYLERLDTADAYTLMIEHAEDCWVRWVESERTFRSHVWAFYSRFLTISGSYFHEAHDYGSGGHGYGVTLADCTSDVLVEDNVFHTLRHAMMVKEGANGNVFGYNYSFDNRLAKSDAVCHGHYNYGNLFEGNVAEQAVVADWWGPSGPFTTVFRNRLSDAEGISVRDHSHDTNVVGNTTPRIEIRKGEDIILFGYPVYMGEVERELVDGNLVDGVLEWSGDPGDFPLPDSHYLDGPPDFWGALPWPAVGADVDLEHDPDLPIPAMVRYDRIVAGDWAPPIPEILEVEPLVRGLDATLTVTHAEPDGEVWFLVSRDGQGEGPCFPAAGDLCVDLVDPTILAAAIADAEGTAEYVLPVPADAPLTELAFQAIVPAGERSTKSNAVTRAVTE